MTYQERISTPLKPGDRIVLKANYGYHNFSDGRDIFQRANHNINGIVRHFINFTEVWIDLETGDYIKTGTGSLYSP